jgi:S-adenosylmethionine/arginine decarboxylase-like enzyme
MAITDPRLGTRMHSFGVVLHGALSDQRWIIFLKAVAKAIGMEAVAEPAVWMYPVDGKGGLGQTILLPITESFIVLDTWPDHRGAYLFVCSCRSFADADIDLVAESFGLRAGNANARFTAELNLA